MIENFEECLVGDFVAYSDSNKDCFGKVKEVREESLLVSPPGQPFDEKEVDSNQVLAVWREAKLDLLEDPPFGFMKLRYDDYVVYESFDPYEYWFDDEMVFPKATGFIHTIGFEAVGVEDETNSISESDWISINHIKRLYHKILDKRYPTFEGYDPNEGPDYFGY